MTSEATALIAPDTQLKRLGYPEILPSWIEGGIVQPQSEIVLPGGEILLPKVELVVPGGDIVVPRGPFEIPRIAVPSRRGRLFFFDEANVSWCPQSGRVYRLAGQDAKVDTPGQNHTDYL